MRCMVFVITLMAMVGCAGLNPNPGERTVDNNWLRGNYDRAFPILTSKANAGEPWAQVRLGAAYESGNGVSKDAQQAVQWYKKAAVQEARGGWAEGLVVGSIGRSGFFNQNSDALIAQYQLSGLYLRGEGVARDLVAAYCLARHVMEKTEGTDLFYCCSQVGGWYVTASMITQRFKEISDAMTPEQEHDAERVFPNWTMGQL